MSNFEIGPQWLCRTCEHCTRQEPPSMIDCKLNADAKLEPAIHMAAGCRSYVLKEIDDE